MINSLKELSGNPDAENQRFGDKIVGLARLRRDIASEGFDCELPVGFGVDREPVDDAELRLIFDDLRSRIDHVLDGRLVGALICRSSASGEKSGTNLSVPVLYDSNDTEASWQRFRHAFHQVRFDPEKTGDQTKPVLVQVVDGNLVYIDKAYRKVGEFKWPRWPNFNQSEPEEWSAVVAPIAKLIREIIQREGKSMFFDVQTKDGKSLFTIQVNDLDELEDDIIDDYLSLYHSSLDYDDEFERIGLNEKGQIVNSRGELLADIGEDLFLSWFDVPAKPTIGVRDEGFVARSHHYARPDMMSVEVCRGLTSYLVGGLPSLSDDRPRGRMLYYFDSSTGQLVERLNLGHDSRRASMAIREHYYQAHCEGFSVDEGRVVAVRDLVGNFYPHFERREFGGSLLDMIRFYARQSVVPIEIEGLFVDERLHVHQVGESPLPDDVIDSLSSVEVDGAIYKSEAGRGVVNYRGDVVIDQGQDLSGVPDDVLVIGFDVSVTSRSNFLFVASDDSIMAAAGRHLVMLQSHLAGYACQVTFEAAREGRRGGVYYVTDSSEFIDSVADYIEDRDDMKVLTSVCVEACIEGMQIYKM
jgi:hypothetical protein